MEQNYILSSEYIENLNFDYFETFSFQRGESFESRAKAGFSNYNRLKRKIEPLTKQEATDFIELESLYGTTQYIFNENGALHYSAKRISKFRKDDSKFLELKNILLTEIIDIPYWMCAPFYRDAVVFKNNNSSIVSQLNICLSCEYIQINSKEFISADEKTYSLLRQFLIELGHKVEPR